MVCNLWSQMLSSNRRYKDSKMKRRRHLQNLDLAVTTSRISGLSENRRSTKNQHGLSLSGARMPTHLQSLRTTMSLAMKKRWEVNWNVSITLTKYSRVRRVILLGLATTRLRKASIQNEWKDLIGRKIDLIGSRVLRPPRSLRMIDLGQELMKVEMISFQPINIDPQAYLDLKCLEVKVRISLKDQTIQDHIQLWTKIGRWTCKNYSEWIRWLSWLMITMILIRLTRVLESRQAQDITWTLKLFQHSRKLKFQLRNNSLVLQLNVLK